MLKKGLLLLLALVALAILSVAAEGVFQGILVLLECVLIGCGAVLWIRTKL